MRILISLLLSVFLFAESKYCNEITNNERSTYIYVDSTLTNKKFLSKLLMKKLKNSFLPHERVVVLIFDPVSQQVEEKFNTCVPILSKEEIKKLNSGSWHLFTESPIDRANEDFQFFVSTLRDVIKNVKVNDNDDSDKKRLVEIFYNQSNRFEKPLNRVIILSDMMQNSNTFPLSAVLNNNFKNIKEYKTNFNYSDVYVLMDKKRLKSSNFKHLRDFWSYYFEYNNAVLKNFDTDIKLPSYKYLETKFYEGEMEFKDGSTYTVKLMFNYSKNKVNNGWFVIEGVDAIPLKGKLYVKHGKVKKGVFNFDTDESFHIFSKSERIEVTFNGKKVTGEIKSINTNLILVTPKGHQLKNPKILLNLEKSDEY